MHVGKVTGCYAVHIHRQRCCTRREFQGMYIPPPSVNKADQSGFETHRKRHQKSETGVSVAQKWTCVQQKQKKKE